MSSKKPSYIVLFDTNTLVEGNPLREAVANLINTYKGDHRLGIKFLIPDVVREEFKKHFLKKVKEARVGYIKHSGDLVNLMNVKLPKFDVEESQVLSKAGKILKDHAIGVLETPIKKINLKGLIKKAVYYEPPFQESKEKGFKDSIIAETIVVNLPKLTKGAQVIFICKDEVLRQYLSTYQPKFPNFKVYESVPDFESELRLYLLERDDKLVVEITKEAEAAFYKSDDKNSLFFKEDIPRKLFETFPTLFANPKIEENRYHGVGVWNTVPKNWIPIEKPEFRVSPPVFIERKDSSLYIWESTVLYHQVFENQATVQNVRFAGFDHRGEFILEFKIRWESEIDSSGKISTHKCKILNIDYTPKVISESYAVASMYPLASGATIAGQGTVPVANVAPYPSFPGEATIVEPFFTKSDNSKEDEP